MTCLLQAPRWLVNKGKDKRSARGLPRITSLSTDDPDLQTELHDIRAALEETMKLGENVSTSCDTVSRSLYSSNVSAHRIYFPTDRTTLFKNTGISKPFLVATDSSTRS